MEFVHLHYSPWSQRAKWALDHHRVAYQSSGYVPGLGEPKLRVRLRRPFGKVTVPVLFEGRDVYDDSWDIARLAEKRGRGEPLFFDESGTRRWNAEADRALAAGRRRATEATLRDPEAQRDALTGIVPDALRGVLRPVAIVVARNFHAKYDAGAPSDLEDALQSLREALDGRPFILDRFSYADIVMAGVLEFVSPGSHVRRRPTERRVWSDARLAKRFADLIEWRDQLIAERWPKRVKDAA